MNMVMNGELSCDQEKLETVTKMMIVLHLRYLRYTPDPLVRTRPRFYCARIDKILGKGIC